MLIDRSSCERGWDERKEQGCNISSFGFGFFFSSILLQLGVLYTSSGLYHSFNAAITVLFNVFGHCMTKCDLSGWKEIDTVSLQITSWIGSEAFT